MDRCDRCEGMNYDDMLRKLASQSNVTYRPSTWRCSNCYSLKTNSATKGLISPGKHIGRTDEEDLNDDITSLQLTPNTKVVKPIKLKGVSEK